MSNKYMLAAGLTMILLLSLCGCTTGAATPSTPASQPAAVENNPPVNARPSYEVEAEQIAAELTDAELCAQMMMVGFAGTEPDHYINKMIEQRHIGGVILFTRNVESAPQVARLVTDLQQQSLQNSGLPLMIATDVEGGGINRFQGIIAGCPSPNEQGLMEASDVRAISRIVAEELRALGVNINLAPVVDVAGPGTVMASRVFSSDVEKVQTCAEAAVAGYQEGGIIATAKHFPGLGDSGLDTHQQPVDITADMPVIEQLYLPPFKRAIAAGVEMVMATHAAYAGLDPGVPASVSARIQTDLLRHELGFEGIIISDDLEMGAAKEQGSIGDFAVRAVKAGTDILLVCHTPELEAEAYEALVEAVASGELSRERVETSARKIIALKLKYRMAEQCQLNPETVWNQVNTPAHQEAIRQIRERYGLQ